MKRFVVWLVLGFATAVWAEPPQLEPLPPREQITMQPVLGDGQAIATPSDTFTITSTPEIRANVSLEKGLVLLLPAGGGKFVMYLQFTADSIDGGQLVSEKQMQETITRLAEPYVAESEEGKPQFKSIKYAGRQGWYAAFTDKRLKGVDPLPAGECRYAVVGLLRLSEASVVHFTLLLNDLASPDFFGPLGYAMRFAKPLPTTRPAEK